MISIKVLKIFFFLFEELPKSHCVKKVRIQSFSGPYFPGPHLDWIRIRKTSNTDTFHAVSISNFNYKSSVMRQKCKSQNLCFLKQGTPNFLKNKHFLPLEMKNKMFVFRKIWGTFVFLKYPFWDSPFCLITDEVRNPSSESLPTTKFMYSKPWFKQSRIKSRIKAKTC